MISVDGSRDWYTTMQYEASVGALVTALEPRPIPQKAVRDPTRTHRRPQRRDAATPFRGWKSIRATGVDVG